VSCDGAISGSLVVLLFTLPTQVKASVDAPRNDGRLQRRCPRAEVPPDPSAKTTTPGMIRAVVGHARAGSIIIFHINGRGWKTHEALPIILRDLRDRGFRFVQLSDLIKVQAAMP